MNKCLIADERTRGKFYCTRRKGHIGPCAARMRSIYEHHVFCSALCTRPVGSNGCSCKTVIAAIAAGPPPMKKRWKPDVAWKWWKWTFGLWHDAGNHTFLGIDVGPLEIVWRYEGYRP